MNITQLQEKFAKRLQELMREKEIATISALAEKTGIPRNTITNWVLHKRTPLIDALWKLSEYFGCSIDYLLGKEN